MKRIYLDNAATTAPYPAVLAAMTDTAQRFYGNPSSLHSEGQAAQKLLSDCRARMAARLGCASDELYFTSGPCLFHLRRHGGGQLGHPRTGAGGREKGEAPHRHLRV